MSLPAGWAADDRKRLADFERANQTHLALDAEGNLTFLADGEWRIEFVAERWPEVTFTKTREHQ